MTDGYGMLAVQGPRSRTVLSALMPEAETLGYFDHVPVKVADTAVTLSRTGYTGDLGFELTVPEDRRGRRARRRPGGRAAATASGRSARRR